MTKAVDEEFRVLKLPVSLVDALRRRRDAEGTTNQQFVADAVAKQLPAIVEQLRSIGLCSQKETRQAVRLPFSTEAGTLKSLRAASNETGLSAIQVLSLCLVAATSGPHTPKQKRGRRSQGAEKCKRRKGRSS